jgi:hypothetical protein
MPTEADELSRGNHVGEKSLNQLIFNMENRLAQRYLRLEIILAERLEGETLRTTHRVVRGVISL